MEFREVTELEKQLSKIFLLEQNSAPSYKNAKLFCFSLNTFSDTNNKPPVAHHKKSLYFFRFSLVPAEVDLGAVGHQSWPWPSAAPTVRSSSAN